MHIKAAKLQGWEDNLSEKIQTLREAEVRLSKRLVQLSAILFFTSGAAPAIAMAITSWFLVGRGDVLDAATLFPVLTLFMQLRFSLNILPETMYNLMEAHVSCRRIHSFLSSAQFSPPTIQHKHQAAISIENLITRWAERGVIATNVSHLSIPRGQLVVVVGGIGAGKSGLLLTMLGELPAETGSVTLGGSIAYVPQNPWIISDSIRNNILFGQPYDTDRYQRAIHCAGLRVDLASFADGDATQIGERGINLSGGQRQRVSLARALYSDADIFLFDDPLSALDPEVANHVFSQLVCSALATKTRIIVTHRVEFALAADRVLVIDDGLIVEDGNPLELQRSAGSFAALIQAHHSMGPSHTSPLLPTDDTALMDDSSDDLRSQSEGLQHSIIEAEERRFGAVGTSTIRTYAARITPGFVLIFVVILFIGRQSAAVSTDLWLTRWADEPAVRIPLFLGGYLLLIASLCLMGYLRTLYLLTRGLYAGAESHKSLLRGVLRSPMAFFEANPVGRILNRFSRDLETTELALPRAILDAGNCLVEVLAVSLVIIIVTPVTLFVIAPIAVVYYLLGTLFRPPSRELQRLTSISLSPIFTLLSECLSGVESLRASALGDSFINRFAIALNAHTKCNHLQTAINRWLGIRLETMGSLLLCAIGLSASLGWSISSGVALSGLALAYASSMTSSMNWAIRSVCMVENYLTSFERIERYSHTTPESQTGAPPPSGWPTDGAIQLFDLSARYRPHLPLALAGISCFIPPGSRVGIIGRTGSGKSTLILSLLRLLEPCGGRIEIDGVDLSTVRLSDLRTSLAVVPQEPVLFSGTLRESLDPFGMYSDEEILKAMKRMELSAFLEQLPDRLNTVVREGGFNFSNGQRQLICLARALLRRSRVVILDEATASIDAHTDRTIQRALRQEFSGATLLIVAHRLGTVLDSDLILALHEGSLVENGPPAELLQNPRSLLSRFVNEIALTHRGSEPSAS
jgi:ABC-type multidrug transport system fused ATPase/permease subunit